MITVPPEPRCDECNRTVEEEQIARSARANGGTPIGPWLCVSCQTKIRTATGPKLLALSHSLMVTQNAFDSICNEADPKLAEAIHRAGYR